MSTQQEKEIGDLRKDVAAAITKLTAALNDDKTTDLFGRAEIAKSLAQAVESLHRTTFN
jgi:hypothetical protein